MSKTRTMEIVSLIGVTLSIYGFLFGVWEGVLDTGWDLLLKVSPSLTVTDNPDAPIAPKIIFFLLIALIIIVFGQLVTHFGEIRVRNELWPVTRCILAIIALVCMGIFIFKFSNTNPGAIITTLGQLFVFGSSLYVAYERSRYRFLDRQQASSILKNLWKNRLASAALENTNLSILSLKTKQYLKPYIVEKINKELRVDDQVFPLKDGAYVLLWKADARVAENVAGHLSNFLKMNQIECDTGISTFPSDGNQLSSLIEIADNHLSALA